MVSDGGGGGPALHLEIPSKPEPFAQAQHEMERSEPGLSNIAMYGTVS